MGLKRSAFFVSSCARHSSIPLLPFRFFDRLERFELPNGELELLAVITTDPFRLSSDVLGSDLAERGVEHLRSE